MLTKNEESFLKTYEPQLKKPTWKFIVIYGISWMLIVGVLTSGVTALFDLENAFWKSGRSLFVTVITWLVAGIIYGLWFRLYLIKRMKKIKAKQAAATAQQA